MPERRRTRSLYWRIALGFIALLATTLLLQAALFVWLAVRTEGGQPPEMLSDVATLLATDLSAALEATPGLDLDAYARRRLRELHRPAAVVFPDGHVIASPDTIVPPGIERFATRRLRRGEPAGLEPMPAMMPRRPAAFAPVRSGGRTVAAVIVLPQRGPRRIVTDFGPLLSAGLVLLLVGGTLVAALVVFRPAHARLRALEAAAREVGRGNLEARANEEGRDEVADVARAFNRMAAELASRQAELADADRTRRQLLADVSHELMTPLTAIRGYAETLTLPRFAPASPDGARYVGIIQEEVERIERLVGDLLDLARWEAGGGELQPVTVRVSDLFARVDARHRRRADDAGITLDVRIADDAAEVTGDPLRLEQALQNLAANALRHTPGGGRVTLGAARRDGRIVLSVTDTGRGIPAEHLPRVFDRFYKADPSRAEAGSGLGLSIVKAIVERHGGRVRATSTPGVETTFEMELPG
ncbi:MAG: sensor histidine kinase [Vicinamibacterales bacterium]